MTNVLVCIKRVPDFSGEVLLTEDAQAADARFVGYTLSNHDACAVELAVQVASATDGAATVLSVGDSDSVEQLRSALGVGCTAAVLVERGWVQRNFVQRDKLPPVATPPGAVELRGRMAPPPGKLYEFSGAGLGPIRQNIELAQFRAETGLALLDLAVQQTGEPSEGLLREWPEAASGAPKHYGYAFQWWALSALIAILYVWFQFIAPRRKALHA